MALCTDTYECLYKEYKIVPKLHKGISINIYFSLHQIKDIQLSYIHTKGTEALSL